MPLRPHERYTRSAALQSLDLSSDSGRAIAGGQIVIAEDTIIVFFTIEPYELSSYNAESNHTQFTSPSHLRWLAESDVSHDALYSDLQKTMLGKHIHLCVKMSHETQFIYAGRALCSSVGVVDERELADFTLDEALARDLWVQMGGYENWLLSVNGTNHAVESWDEMQPHLQLIHQAETQFHEIELTRYENDHFVMLTRDDLAFVMYLRWPGDSGMSSRSTEPLPEEPAIVFRYCGQATEIPSTSVISKRHMLPIIEHFVTQKRLPDWIMWGYD